MPTPKLNNKAPVFKGECTGNKTISLTDLKGKNVVLYFYPKDSTPGCTTEGQNFRDLKGKFTRANTIIFGLSRESIKSHENFKKKEKFNFDLISDPDEKICKQYDVIKECYQKANHYINLASNSLSVFKDCEEKTILENLTSFSLSRDF